MLEQLNQLIKKGGVLTPELLARQLNTSTEIVVMMLEDLERRGLLSEASSLQNCGQAACKGCSVVGSCPLGGARIWQPKENTPGIN
jgi:hypothetical protein